MKLQGFGSSQQSNSHADDSGLIFFLSYVFQICPMRPTVLFVEEKLATSVNGAGEFPCRNHRFGDLTHSVDTCTAKSIVMTAAAAAAVTAMVLVTAAAAADRQWQQAAGLLIQSKLASRLASERVSSRSSRPCRCFCFCRRAATTTAAVAAAHRCRTKDPHIISCVAVKASDCFRINHFISFSNVSTNCR